MELQFLVLALILLVFNSTAQNTGDIRLFYGTDQSGAVQLYQSDAWKSICGWNFRDTEALVACQQLGFSNGKALPLGAYGQLSGISSYSGVLNKCSTGQESRLTDCEFDNDAICSEEEMAYASANCYNTTIPGTASLRLESSSTEEPGLFAAVSVYGAEIWGRICASFWDDSDARVVCHQLGYGDGIATILDGDTTVPFLLSEVNCVGNESSLEACSQNTEFCYDTRSAAVVCFNDVNQGPAFSLVGGHSSSFGKVVIAIDGKQGLLCKSRYEDNTKIDITWKEAYSICKTMGFTSGSVLGIDLDTPGIDTVVLESMSCEGDESVWECTNQGWGDVDAQCEGQQAGVVLNCYSTARLYNGLAVEAERYHMGRVEMFVDGRWYAVCADRFDKTAASVTCKQLGYPVATIITPDSFSNRYGSSHINSVTCSGSETNLTDCTYTQGRCTDHNDHAALLCSQQNVEQNVSMTLSGSYYGEIEVMKYGLEGTVCMKGWDNTEANVACKSAGFKSGTILAGSKQYVRYKPVWAFNFACTGTEARLEDCDYDTEFRADDWTCAEDLTSAGVLCFDTTTPPDTLVRLQAGSSSSEGRVEVFSPQTGWGTICNSGWSISDAQVVCKQLGYPDGQTKSSGFSQAGSDVPVLLSNVQCEGDESSLLECSNSGWTKVSSLCLSHTRDAGVFCYTHISLTPFRSYGAVQYHNGDEYGLVCADNFDQKAADVICKEMGFNYAKVLCCSAFGPRSEDITMSDLSCPGSANSISDCTYNDANPSCNSGDYASVVCSDFTHGFTKITANPIVTVSYFLHDGYVCTESFTDSDAMVLCRQQGLPYGYAYKTAATGLQIGIRWLQGLGCAGTESSFLDCTNQNWGQVGSCDYSAVAAVVCSDNKGDMDFNMRLAGGTSTAGRVEVYIESAWGTVCGTDLTKPEAEVICRNLGYHGGIAMAAGHYGAGSYPSPQWGFTCKGDESSLKDCIWRPYSDNACPATQTAAVTCFYNIRLSGSTTINYGRLEVYDNNKNDWVAVCDRNQGLNEAMTLCRQMGYSDGMFQRGSALGPTDRAITITGISCGSQSECTFENGICPTGKYISLYCSATTIVNEDVAVRLPLSSFYGPVSIQRFGLWGHVCSEGFNDNDALVVCSELGYLSGMALCTFATKGYPIIQGQMKCTGTETKLEDCSSRSLFSAGHDCYNINTVAGVLCYSGDGVTFGSTDLNYELGQMNSAATVIVDGTELHIDMPHFNDTDAAVYCNTLAFAGGEAVKQSYGSYGITELSCTGEEESILQCPAIWDPSRTQNLGDYLAGVNCYTAVRLVGGNPALYGAVYTSKGINNGPVCGAGFDEVDARVACGSLRYDNGLVLCCSPFGSLEDAAILTNVQCTGEERQFTDCLHDNVVQGQPEACKQDYAAVACYNGQYLPTDYRLSIAGGGGYTGTLMLAYLDINGSVCMDGWDDDDAHVACRELGYVRGVAYRAARSDSPLPFWTSNVQCGGSEVKLSDCQMTELGRVTQCSDTLSHAGVICFNNEGIFYRLGGSGEYRYGRVEVSLNGEWRSLCNLNWDHQDTEVLCRKLGFRTGEAYSGALRDEFRGPVWEVNFMCDGSEASLNDCRSSGWRVSTIPSCALHQNDAAAFCYKSVKLSTGVGRQTDQGAVLLYFNDQWHTVCNKGFTHVSARAVCRELGFVDGQMQLGTLYGSLVEYPRLNTHTVICRGDESDITDCLVEEPCDVQDYASVVCYGFTLSTEQPTLAPPKEDSLNATPIIIAAAVAIALILLAAVVAYCIYKRRQRKKLNKSKEIADKSIIGIKRDGSVEVSNRLHGLVETPDLSRVRYANRGGGEGQVNLDSTYLNPTYHGRTNGETRPPASRDTVISSTSHTYDYPDVRERQSRHYDNLQLDTDQIRLRDKKEDKVEKDNDMHTSFYISPFAEQGVLRSPSDIVDGTQNTF